MAEPGFRVEHDSMGEVLVPADALWAAQTQRAVQNFHISGERLSRDLISALASIKGAAAVINGELGVLAPDMAQAIQDAYLDGRKQEAETMVPAELVERTSLIGPEGYVRERLAAYRESGVTTLNVTPLAPTHEARVRLVERVARLAA